MTGLTGKKAGPPVSAVAAGAGNLPISPYNRIVWDPISIGNKTEGKVLAALADAGYQILLPFGSGCRYDLAFDDHGMIKRVQCKTGQLLENRGAVDRCATEQPGQKNSLGEGLRHRDLRPLKPARASRQAARRP